MNKSGFKLFGIFLLLFLNTQMYAQYNNGLVYKLTKGNFILNKNLLLKKLCEYSFNNAPFPAKRTANISGDNLRMDSLIVMSVVGDTSKVSLSYNLNGNLSEVLYQDKSGGVLNNSIQEIYTYNEDNNLVSSVDYGWSSGKWDTLDCETNNYNDNGSLFQTVVQSKSGDSLVNFSRYTYYYDGLDANADTALIENWQNNQWQKNMLTSYFYSGSGKKDSIIFYTWGEKGWVNDSKTNFYYHNNQTALDSIVVKSWGGLWMNYLKEAVTNDQNNNEIEQVYLDWTGYTWRNSMRLFYAYNDFNFITKINCQLWENNSWTDDDGAFTISNPEGYLAEFIAAKVLIYYSNVTGLKNNETLKVSNFYLSQNYPNPFNPSTTINYSIPKSSFVTIKVYNILGRKITTLVNAEKLAGNYSVHFNAAKLASGVYIYKINAGKYSKSKLMILEK